MGYIREYFYFLIEFSKRFDVDKPRNLAKSVTVE
jgi:glucosamine 6-phosphate synthetase-like amidotransferase/phosphosugar isomerase protein